MVSSWFVHSIYLSEGGSKNPEVVSGGDLDQGVGSRRFVYFSLRHSMPRAQENGVQEQALGGRRHGPVIGVVGERDDVSVAGTLVEHQRFAGHEFERLGPAKPAREQVAGGEIDEVPSVRRLERGENQLGIDQGQDLGRKPNVTKWSS